MFQTPILLLIFNRLDTTKEVFKQIQKIRPSKLYIAADGPRVGNDNDKKKCLAVRNFIDEAVDWDCEVKKLYREKNLGCGLAVSGAISWFFENEEDGIILEDDTLPDLSFFTYCESLLKKYEDNLEVGIISGNNFQFGINRTKASYYFSAYPHIWGWATWRRSWKHFRYDIENFDLTILTENLNNFFPEKEVREYWLKSYENDVKKQVNNWDFRFMYSLIYANKLHILPNQNLVTNIGFREDATHTTFKEHQLSNLPIKQIRNIKHQHIVSQHKNADLYTSELCFDIFIKRSLVVKIFRKIYRILLKLV